jgi:hypothetical protein
MSLYALLNDPVQDDTDRAAKEARQADEEFLQDTINVTNAILRKATKAFSADENACLDSSLTAFLAACTKKQRGEFLTSFRIAWYKKFSPLERLFPNWVEGVELTEYERQRLRDEVRKQNEVRAYHYIFS